MSEIKTQPVTAQRVDDIDTSDAPGAFELFVSGDRVAGMTYRCPCGCGVEGALPFRPHESPSWEWDGNREKPTLQPSVHHRGHWHGYLSAGVWASC